MQQIWDEVGESDEARDKMLLQLEYDCLDVYRKKVDMAVKSRAQLLNTLSGARVELTNLQMALGEKNYVGIVSICTSHMEIDHYIFAFVNSSLRQLH